MRVTNLNGTSDKDCSCGSWLRHWALFNTKGQKLPKLCPACKQKLAEVGAHVQKADSDRNDWYIVPLCKGCNNQSSDVVFDIGDCALASANKAKTCDR